jgi:hypothetical protein
MKKTIRKILIYFLRFLMSLFISKKKILLSKDLIILGRGMSLNSYFNNYKKLNKIENVLTVNFTKKDVDYKVNSLRNKNIIPLVNIEEPIMSLFHIVKLNISMCFISRTLDQKEETEKRRNYKGSLYGKVNYFTGQIVKDFYDKKISGSGLLAVVYFVKILKVKNIYLFGFDFYQQGMHNISLIDNFKTEESIKVHLDDGKKSKIDFENFIENNKETNFFFPKNTNISVKSSNFYLLDF